MVVSHSWCPALEAREDEFGGSIARLEHARAIETRSTGPSSERRFVDGQTGDFSTVR